MRGYLLAYAIAVAFIIIGKPFLLRPPVKVLGPLPLPPRHWALGKQHLLGVGDGANQRQVQTKYSLYYRGIPQSQCINLCMGEAQPGRPLEGHTILSHLQTGLPTKPYQVVLSGGNFYFFPASAV